MAASATVITDDEARDVDGFEVRAQMRVVLILGVSPAAPIIGDANSRPSAMRFGGCRGRRATDDGRSPAGHQCHCVNFGDGLIRPSIVEALRDER